MIRPALRVCLAPDLLQLERHREEFHAIALFNFNKARNCYNANHLHQERIVDNLAHWVGGFSEPREKVPVAVRYKDRLEGMKSTEDDL